MEVPEALLEATERKLAKLDAFLDESGWVEVGFLEEQNPRIPDKFHCEIVAHLKGKRLKVEGSAGEPFAALDAATSKVEKQVRRLKDKRVRRRQRGNGQDQRGADAVPPTAMGLDSDPIPSDDREPAIVEVREAEGKPMSPAEAALQLQVLGQDFLLFQNAETDRAAVIYRRRDGDYGLVETPG